jgi:hypothetical protein
MLIGVSKDPFEVHKELGKIWLKDDLFYDRKGAKSGSETVVGTQNISDIRFEAFTTTEGN